MNSDEKQMANINKEKIGKIGNFNDIPRLEICWVVIVGSFLINYTLL